MTRTLLLCFFAVILTFAGGCSNSATVTGSVSVDGKALTMGEVIFHPTKGSLAIGSIVEGKYQLSTGQVDQVEPGEYVVTVNARELPTTELATDAQGNVTEAVGKLLTPEIYTDPATSPLKASVKPGANQFDFDLKTPPAPATPTP